MGLNSLKKKVGCWLNERRRTELVLRLSAYSWLDLCNRHESLSTTDEGRARMCNWPDTSPLTVCQVFPEIGTRLLMHCLNLWPITFSDGVESTQEKPDITFIIAFRGLDRLAQLQCCLAALRAQADVRIEIILVEQSWQRLLSDEDILGVKYIHARSISPDMPFNKSWGMNIGARHAKAETLIFHDGDILAPSRYAKSIVELMLRGYQAARVPRLVFYLQHEQSVKVQQSYDLGFVKYVDEVRENCRGISLAIDKKAYWDVGGHDESFYGWGGEDDEILQRAETLNFYPGGFMPFVHLWHPAQKEKLSGMIEREQFTKDKLNSSVTQRISVLRECPNGEISSPCFPESS